jgi:hypothetical protein
MFLRTSYAERCNNCLHIKDLGELYSALPLFAGHLHTRVVAALNSKVPSSDRRIQRDPGRDPPSHVKAENEMVQESKRNPTIDAQFWRRPASADGH